MAQKDQAAARVYEDFEPSYEWAQDEGSDTLILMLRGFRKEDLKVQISNTRILKISGEQQINEKTWRRFRKEFKVPPHSDTNGIKAKFEGGLLYVRLPKVITEAKPATTKPTPVAPNNETDNREKPREDKAEEAKPARTPTQKTPHEEPKTSEVSQKKPQEQASYETKEMGKTGADDNNVVQDKTKATTSEDQVMHEKTNGLGKSENKVDKRSHTLYGLIMERGMQKKLGNLMVVILVLVLGLYVKNAIKSSFGGSRIQEP